MVCLPALHLIIRLYTNARTHICIRELSASVLSVCVCVYDYHLQVLRVVLLAFVVVVVYNCIQTSVSINICQVLGFEHFPHS